MITAKKLALLALFLVMLNGNSSAAPATTESNRHTTASQRELVILIHGIAKRKIDMIPLSRAMRNAGYEVLNWEYPSRRADLDELAAMLWREIDQRQDRSRIHIVCHSMGGIVARRCLSTSCPANMGRFVMIATPNQGAYLADWLGDYSWFKWYFGPAGQQLRESERGACASAGVPPCEFGIIAGGRNKPRGMNPMIKGDNDGTVSVECTHLEGAKDFLLLPYPHFFIHMMPRTIRQVTAFLRTGSFHK